MKGYRRAPSAIFPLLVAACVSVFSIAGQSAQAERVEDLPKPTDYVSDYAHVLSPAAIAHLDSICAELDHSNANAQIAVVTIHTLDGMDPAEFANALEDKWKMGRKGSDKGVLVFLAVNDHKYRIEVGYGLEGILPDGKVGDIGREMVPDLRANDYDGAVLGAVGEVAQVIAADANVTLSDNDEAAPVRHRNSTHTSSGTVKLIIFFLFFGVFIIVRILSFIGILPRTWGHRGVWIGGGGGGFGGGGGGGGGFGGFGGGGFGGGGAGGSW
ncbi:MAG: TPM domain-containing protein [Terracidiphilus sp.]